MYIFITDSKEVYSKLKDKEVVILFEDENKVRVSIKENAHLFIKNVVEVIGKDIDVSELPESEEVFLLFLNPIRHADVIRQINKSRKVALNILFKPLKIENKEKEFQELINNIDNSKKIVVDMDSFAKIFSDFSIAEFCKLMEKFAAYLIENYEKLRNVKEIVAKGENLFDIIADYIN